MHYTARICVQKGTPNWIPPARVEYIDLEDETLDGLAIALGADPLWPGSCFVCAIADHIVGDEVMVERHAEGTIDPIWHGEHDEDDHFAAPEVYGPIVAVYDIDFEDGANRRWFGGQGETEPEARKDALLMASRWYCLENDEPETMTVRGYRRGLLNQL